MKKERLIIIITALIVTLCLVTVAVASYSVGYAVGNSATCNEKHTQASGVYRCDKWNGDQTVVLVLNQDGTCRLPTGIEATWIQDGSTIRMTYNDQNRSGEIVGDNVGIIYSNLFFEKIS